MVNKTGKVVSINTSEDKGRRKKPVKRANLLKDYGIEGDAHASGKWHRQVSLLAIESIRKMQDAGLDVTCGDFAENITTEGLELKTLPIGTLISLGGSIEAEVTQIGKECHSKCEIFYQAGQCVMPEEGIFVRILRGGTLLPGDAIEIHEPGGHESK
ncbi:MAG: MOSC domain-containing protein [Nitrospirae bacterium]|nr:MOSC domain-containing protein [Nitrospirota bacterium]